MPFNPHPAALRTRYHGSGGVGFSLAEVHQELQMLQRQLGDQQSALVRLRMHDLTCCELTVCLKQQEVSSGGIDARLNWDQNSQSEPSQSL